MVAAGEFFIGATLYDYRVRTLRSQGAPINSVALSPIMAFPNVLMLARYAPNPHAAALFIDWLLSETGQKLIESDAGKRSNAKGSGSGDRPNDRRTAAEGHRTRRFRTQNQLSTQNSTEK